MHSHNELVSHPIAPQDASINSYEEDELPTLPLEVMSMALDYLQDFKDFANVAQTNREFRELIYSCDVCWERAFYQDYGHMNAEDYSSLPTWRQKYM